MVTATGRKFLNTLELLYDLSVLIVVTFSNLPKTLKIGTRPIARVFLKQVYFTGIEAVKVIMIIAFAVGIAIISQIFSIGDSGSGSLSGKVLIWVVVRELGPLITALVIIARSGSAISTELAQMKIGGEIEHLEALGIPAEHYLILPRILGISVSLLILTIYFEMVAIAGSFTVASFGWHIPIEQFLQGIISVLTFKEIAISVIKSLVFGLFISAIACREGITVSGNVTQIPIAATRTVIKSLIMIFILDGIISFLFLF